MKCLNPITIPNMSRFFVKSKRHKLLVDVNCGKCANCQRNKSAEWKFRTYKQFEACINRGGFVLFDTLTYRPADVPHLIDFDEFSLLSEKEDFMCFNFRDVRLFFVRLRKALSKLGFKKDVFSYFVASEYGTNKNCTHRPHYHVLFFVNVPIEPLVFSRLISDAWPYGRTDGIPYQTSAYVNNNVFRSLTVSGRMVCNYVASYVQKKSSFQKVVDKRIDIVLHRLSDSPDFALSSDAAVVRRRLNRIVSQFHRQSHGFGISALDDLDTDKLFERGFFLLPNGRPTMFDKIPISQYYLRKICYQKVRMLDGYQYWVVRDDRVDLIEKRSQAIKRNLARSLVADGLNYNVSLLNPEGLADYCYSWKGRFANDDDAPIVRADYKKPCLYVYASPADKNHFGHRIVSTKYLGWSGNYLSVDDALFCKLTDFIEENVVSSSSFPFLHGFDEELYELRNRSQTLNEKIQEKYEKMQNLTDMYKFYGLRI